MIAKDAAWITDLRTQGFTYDELNSPGPVVANRQIAFGSDSELVVLNDHEAVAKPNKVHAFVLDSGSGRIIGGRDWVTKGFAIIFATSKGGYVARTDRGLVRYSPGLREVLATSTESAKMISPDGGSLAGWTRGAGHGVTVILDADTLRPRDARFLDKNVDSVFQNRIAYTSYPKGSRSANVFVEDGKAKFPPYKTECPEVRSHFLSAEVLAIFGCDRIEIVRVGEGMLFSVKTTGDASFAAASRDGHRFAFSEIFYAGGDPATVSFERIVAVDVKQGGAIFTTEIADLHGLEPGGSGAALSPSGSLLAVTSLGMVRMFRLAEAGPP